MPQIFVRFSCILVILVINFYSAWAEEPPKNHETSCLILGGGVGGLTSAIYLGRAGLNPIVIEGKNPGGLITQSHMVQNWPGEMEISGEALSQQMRAQAIANGAEIVSEVVVGIDFSKRPFRVITKKIGYNNQIERKAQSVIIAMGTEPNYLNIPGEQGEEGFWGRGVTNCAICDGAFYKDLIVGVVGGGDAAVLEAQYLSNIAKEVNVFIRKNAFRVSEKKRLQNLLNNPKVKVYYETEVKEVLGDQNGVQAVMIQTQNGPLKKIPLSGLFLAIGSTPNSNLFRGVLKMDKQGYIAIKNGQETSIPGVYAVGDIADPLFKQAITASADGAKAAMQAQMFLSNLKDRGEKKSWVFEELFPQKNEILRTNLFLPKTQSETLKIAAHQGKVIEITSVEHLQEELKKNSTPVFIDFYAPWCGPCRLVAPRVEEAAKNLAGKVRFYKVNVDRVSNLGAHFQIRALPTAVFIDKKGKVKEKKSGADGVIELIQQLEDSYLNRKSAAI